MEKIVSEKIVCCAVCGQRWETVKESLGHHHFTEGFTAEPNDKVLMDDKPIKSATAG